MSKPIIDGEEIYVAPKMLGKVENGVPVIIDEQNDNTRLDPNNLDDKIKIYEREVNGWFINPALLSLHNDSFLNSYLALMVCMSYVEGVEQYRQGSHSRNKSKQFFISSINRIFPNKYSNKNIEKLYREVRCGLFHNGMTEGSITFNNTYPDSIKFENSKKLIRVNPSQLLLEIKNDFQQFINELKIQTNTEARTKFNRMFKIN